MITRYCQIRTKRISTDAFWITAYYINEESFNRLTGHEDLGKSELACAELVHTDETGINIGGKVRWMLRMSNKRVDVFQCPWKARHYGHGRNGYFAAFKDTLCHDYWKPQLRVHSCAVHCPSLSGTNPGL